MVKHCYKHIACLGKAEKDDFAKVRRGIYEQALFDKNYLNNKNLLIELVSRSERVFYIGKSGKPIPMDFEFLEDWIKQLEDGK